MAFDIQNFKSNFKDGGARPTLYEVQLAFPLVSDSPEFPGGDGTNATTKLKFTCQAASLPTSRLAPIEVPYFGRTIKVSGNRNYPDWIVTVMNDESMVVRKSLEAWHAKIDSVVPNVMSPDFADGSYKTIALVRQYAKAGAGGNPEGNLIRTYEMVGTFPTEVSEIPLAWAEQNRIEQYQVSFAYDWWVPVATVDLTSSLGTVGNQVISPV